jgi:hypothetical protein
MRRRFVLNADGDLEARDGTILGRVVGLTIDVSQRGTIGGSFSLEKTTTVGGGLGEEGPALLPSPIDEVWSTYVEIIRPRRAKLDPDGRRVISDALKVATVPECQRAIVGCSQSDWHMGRSHDARADRLFHRDRRQNGRRCGSRRVRRPDKALSMQAGSDDGVGVSRRRAFGSRRRRGARMACGARRDRRDDRRRLGSRSSIVQDGAMIRRSPKIKRRRISLFRMR